MTAEQGRGPAEGGWREAIAPFAQRLRVAAALPGFEARWNSVGAKALLSVLEEMARKLDLVAPARIEELRRERDAALARLAETEAALAAAQDQIAELMVMRKTYRYSLSRLFESRRFNAQGAEAGPSPGDKADPAGS
jgi:hypothetical protein